MKKYVENNVKSALSKPLRGRRYRRLLSIGISALLSISTFITAIPQMSVPVYAAGTDKKLQLGASALANNAGAGGAATVYYGKNDRTWRVIGYPGEIKNAVSCANCVTLLSSQVIGTSIFHSNTGAQTDNDYHGSDLKTAVNNICSDTYFSAEEQNAIEKRELTVEEYKPERPYSDGVSGTPLTGEEAPKLWPLSSKETDTLFTNAAEVAGIGLFWWLRSPGPGNIAAIVDNNGIVYDGYDGYTVNYSAGVRPAFNINLSSIILTSAAVDGKDAGSTTGTLKEIADYSGSDWKLTILESSRNGFTVSAGTGATLSKPVGYTYWTVPVAYSDAPSGTNEHVSAILTNKDGVAQYYGHIDHEVTIPTGLPGGTYYLKVFSEQCNVDKKTDLASPMSTIELKVKAKYDLEFDKNGGSGTMTSTEVYDGDTYTFPECGFTAPDDKTFYYWEMSGVDGDYQPEDDVLISDNCATNGKITVKAHWKAANKAVVKTEPAGKALKYNGSEQELVSDGEAEHGTMNYAIGDDDTTAPTTGWSETVPKRKDKGTYYVWYKAKGTGGYADSDPECTEATISDKDPVKVDKVELSDDKLSLIPGESEQLTATIVPEDATNQKVSWKVDDESIAKISSDDKECTVTAVAAGETTVTVTTKDGGKEAVCTVIVEDKPGPKPEKCTITFDANGGKGEMDDQTVDKGVRTQLNKNKFTRSGYSFDSWNTRADGSGTGYDDRDHVTVNDSITLYAQWEKEKHKDDDDDDDYEEEPAPKNDEKYPDGFDELRGLLNNAASAAKTTGLVQTVTWNKSTSLPADVMKKLHDNPNVTLVFSYTYQGVPITLTIPGSAVVLNPAVEWYGPAYLYGLYGKGKTAALTTNTNASIGTYTIKSGDTLSGIAKRLHTTVKNLQDANNIKDADKIKPGMVLKY